MSAQGYVMGRRPAEDDEDAGWRARIVAEAKKHDAVTALVGEAEALVAARLRQRIIERIAESREKELRQGFPSLPTTEQQALAMIKGIGQELMLAGQALEVAARQFKNLQGQGQAANTAIKAARRAQQAAEGLIGSC